MLRLLGACLSIAALFDATKPALHRFEAVEPHMGTLVRVTLYAPHERAAKDAFRAAFARISDLDRILSDYRPDSELNHITSVPPRTAVRVSDDLFAVLAASQELAELTGGAFDITQGPVIRLWREARTTGRVPDRAALREAAGRSGYARLHLNRRDRMVTLDTAGMALDVGAIGKGYAASEMIEVLRARGVRSALVAVSGDLAFGDAPPGQRGWRIGVHTLNDPDLNIPAVLELTNAAVSTSGSSEQYAEVDARRYSHIIDPSSGMGLLEDVTVTVLARHGLEADGLDTAVSVLGVERGLALVDARAGAAALAIRRSRTGPDAALTVHASSRFRGIAERHGAVIQKPDL